FQALGRKGREHVVERPGVTDTRDLSIGRIDKLGVHRHPDVGMRERRCCDRERDECSEKNTKRSSHEGHHSTDCGAKVTRNSVTREVNTSGLRFYAESTATLRFSVGAQTPAAPPSARGSWPPSRLRLGCSTTAPAWPIVSE